jgi:hypothetical protein
MNKRKYIHINVLIALFLFFSGAIRPAFGQSIVKQGNAVPLNFCIEEREMNLYRMINDYRQQYSLPPIPLSKSLSYVAALHAKDLFLNHPDQGTCNFHSWSNKGFWMPFCYPKDENKKNSIWDKPRELTKYPSKAYEIVYWENNPLITDTIIMVWKTEDYFNSFLLNTGKWQGKPWNAIGIAVYANYACAWFGEMADPEGDVIVCGSAPVIKAKDTVKQAKDTLKKSATPKAKPAVKPVVTPPKAKPKKTSSNKPDSLAVKRNDSLKTVASTTPTVVSEISVQPKDSATGTYYIIVNSTLPREAAIKLVNTLKSKGYTDAKLLENNGKLRVSIHESHDKAAITVKLKEVKVTYRDAWLLKKP